MKEKKYEKKYKQALDKARAIIEDYKKRNLKDILFYAKEDLQGIFPELKESEEERIRKCVKYAIDKLFLKEKIVCDVHKDDVIAWLEKQGEKPINYTDEEIVEAVKNTSVLDMVEQKFKVGDWITDGEAVFHITSYDIDYGYRLETQKGTSFHFSNENVENKYHLWTIQDAKDGDMLQLGEVTAIFKKYIGQEKCICYCSVCEGEFEVPIENGEDNIYGCTNITPATKEQCDLLFQKMKEAGYEWNAEKKEPRKIGQEELSVFENSLKHIIEETIEEGDTHNLKADAELLLNLIQKPSYEEMKEALRKEYEKGRADAFAQMHKEWSEEDETGWTNTMIMVKDCASNHYTKDSIDLVVKWLNSLKQRIGG